MEPRYVGCNPDQITRDSSSYFMPQTTMPTTTTTPVLLQPRGVPAHQCSPDLGALNARLEDARPATVICWTGSGRTKCGLNL